MKPAHIVVAGIAVGAGILAAMLAGSGNREPPPAPVEVQAPQAPVTSEVLVAVGNIPIGGTINAGNVDWRRWPVEAVGPYFIQRSSRPQAREELSGSITRSPFSVGEPINPGRIITGTRSGFMAAILPQGYRAIAVPITPETGAGGFILPNDRVDVLLTRRDRSGGQETFVTDTLLTNIRVLAIDQLVQERDGEKSQIGRTATLELEPRQTETMALAKQLGEISLALRSLADAPTAQGERGQTTDLQQRGGSITVIRYGVTLQVPTLGK